MKDAKKKVRFVAAFGIENFFLERFRSFDSLHSLAARGVEIKLKVVDSMSDSESSKD